MSAKYKTINVTVSGYVYDFLETIAKEAGVSVNDAAAYFFALEVVHT